MSLFFLFNKKNHSLKKDSKNKKNLFFKIQQSIAHIRYLNEIIKDKRYDYSEITKDKLARKNHKRKIRLKDLRILLENNNQQADLEKVKQYENLTTSIYDCLANDKLAYTERPLDANVAKEKSDTLLKIDLFIQEKITQLKKQLPDIEIPLNLLPISTLVNLREEEEKRLAELQNRHSINLKILEKNIYLKVFLLLSIIVIAGTILALHFLPLGIILSTILGISLALSIAGMLGGLGIQLNNASLQLSTITAKEHTEWKKALLPIHNSSLSLYFLSACSVGIIAGSLACLAFPVLGLALSITIGLAISVALGLSTIVPIELIMEKQIYQHQEQVYDFFNKPIHHPNLKSLL